MVRLSAMAAVLLIALALYVYLSRGQPLEFKYYDPSSQVKQIECITTAIYHEARGEPFMGQVAVAHVIMNRVRANRWGDTPCSVVYQPAQFTDIEKCQPDRDSSAWKEAERIAIVTYNGLDEDPTNGATHYFSHTKIKPPWWAAKKEVYARLYNHTFLGAKTQ